MQLHTPQGTREATPEEETEITTKQDLASGKTKLREGISKATSLQQELDAIKEYLGV